MIKLNNEDPPFKNIKYINEGIGGAVFMTSTKKALKIIKSYIDPNIVKIYEALGEHKNFIKLYKYNNDCYDLDNKLFKFEERESFCDENSENNENKKIKKYNYYIIEYVDGLSIYDIFLNYFENYIISYTKNEMYVKKMELFCYYVVNVIYNIAKALEDVLKKCGFIHNDLHLNNVLLNPNDNIVKIIDYDRATIKGKYESVDLNYYNDLDRYVYLLKDYEYYKRRLKTIKKNLSQEKIDEQIKKLCKILDDFVSNKNISYLAEYMETNCKEKKLRVGGQLQLVKPKFNFEDLFNMIETQFGPALNSKLYNF